jgi:hypothetical protein
MHPGQLQLDEHQFSERAQVKGGIGGRQNGFDRFGPASAPGRFKTSPRALFD